MPVLWSSAHYSVSVLLLLQHQQLHIVYNSDSVTTNIIMGNSRSSLQLQPEDITAIQEETGFNQNQIERLYSRWVSVGGVVVVV